MLARTAKTGNCHQMNRPRREYFTDSMWELDDKPHSHRFEPPKPGWVTALQGHGYVWLNTIVFAGLNRLAFEPSRIGAIFTASSF